MIAEAFEIRSGYNPLRNRQPIYAMLKDMYLVDFNPDHTVSFSKKLEKTNTVEIPSWMNGPDLRKYGVFDYLFTQKINAQDDFVFFYTMNDQEGTKAKMSKKPLWTWGIVSNVGGEYGFETLPLYGENKKYFPVWPKTGTSALRKWISPRAKARCDWKKSTIRQLVRDRVKIFRTD